MDAATIGPAQLLNDLAHAGAPVNPHLICQAEVTHFDPEQRGILLPLLWKYIIDHRQSADQEELVAVGSAIRKYVSVMPMDRMGDLSVLLAPGDHELPLELELEVAKMIYRNFEAYPPAEPDPQPKLASLLWEIAKAYINPRILIQGKHSAAASLAIEAIVAMRSSHALKAWRAANVCPHRWFGEIVADDLRDLEKRWAEQGAVAAADWLGGLRERVFCPHPEQEVNSAEHA